ncbi:uncharacterized protein METZ01_LOCUS119775, partial [marine metagenome]|jgi:hypothetical protein
VTLVFVVVAFMEEVNCQLNSLNRLSIKTPFADKVEGVFL